MTDSNKPPHFRLPATKVEVGFAIADTVLALKSLQLAMLALRSNDQEAFDTQMADLNKYTEELWSKFQKLMGPLDE